MNKLLIIGAGGHGRVVADIAKACGSYEKVAFLDDAPIAVSGGVPIIGKIADAAQYIDSHVFIVAIGDNNVRHRLMQQVVDVGASLASLIHPSAVVSPSARIGEGCVVMPNAVINCGAILGRGCIINTAATVDHDCVLAAFVHLSPGVHLAGNVQIGHRTWLGTGAVVSNNLSITQDCIIGAGAVVVKTIEDRGTYVGVPARKIK